MIDKTKRLYSTSDLGLASTLITLDTPLVKMDNSDKSKVRFYFENNGDLEVMVNKYWSDSLTANPRFLFNNSKMLKNRIYSE